MRDDFDGGLVFGRGGGLFSPGFGFVINPPLVDEADRGKEDVAELVVELVSLFASPLVGLNKGIQNVNSSNIIYLFPIPNLIVDKIISSMGYVPELTRVPIISRYTA